MSREFGHELRTPSVTPGVDTPVWIMCQQFDECGVSMKRLAELDGATTNCTPKIPGAGIKILSSPGADAFLWIGKSGPGEAIMLQTKLKDLQPLATQPTVTCNFIHGGINPAEVISRPQDAHLIHIGSSDEAMDKEIKARAGVERVIHIQPHLHATRENNGAWEEFQVLYNTGDSRLHLFPTRGDQYLSFDVGNRTTLEASQPLPLKYGDYMMNGGVIGWSFMKDAYSLSTDEMQKKYPRNKSYRGTPAEYAAQVALVAHNTLGCTEKQIQMYTRLRLIPSEIQQAIYVYGLYDPQKPGGINTPLVHPQDLSPVALVGQVLRFTKDTNREYRLQAYLRAHKQDSPW